MFNNMGKGKDEWFDCSNIIDFLYMDIISLFKNYCVME